ncbi:hypothetical protein GJU40_19860, partial [Bacillus lacus]
MSRGSVNESFSYDYAGRLESWNNNGRVTTYKYDKSGNLLNPKGKSITFNESNEIEGFLYSVSGQLIQDDTKKYQWDLEGNLVKITDLNGSIIATYTYDPNGLRKSKTIGTATYRYYYDGLDLTRITDNYNNTLWTFTWAYNKPLSVTNREGKVFYYLTNYRGDIIGIEDSLGNAVATFNYDPFGNVVSLSENAEVSGQPLGYAGYIYDRETKMYYLKARYYDTSTAAFISRDPVKGYLSEPSTQNSYIYAINNPVSFID